MFKVSNINTCFHQYDVEEKFPLISIVGNKVLSKNKISKTDSYPGSFVAVDDKLVPQFKNDHSKEAFIIDESEIDEYLSRNTVKVKKELALGDSFDIDGVTVTLIKRNDRLYGISKGYVDLDFGDEETLLRMGYKLFSKTRKPVTKPKIIEKQLQFELGI